MFSSISHEFRTPLNAFMHAVSLMKDSFSNYSMIAEISQDQERKAFKEVKRFEKFNKIATVSTSTLQSLVEDILDLAKMEAGTFSLNIFPFKLQKLMDDISYIFGFQCEQKGIDFQINLEG